MPSSLSATLQWTLHFKTLTLKPWTLNKHYGCLIEKYGAELQNLQICISDRLRLITFWENKYCKWAKPTLRKITLERINEDENKWRPFFRTTPYFASTFLIAKVWTCHLEGIKKANLHPTHKGFNSKYCRYCIVLYTVFLGMSKSNHLK